MEIKKILEHKKNALLNREEITLIVRAEITPSVKQAAELFSEKFSKPVENIVVESIKGQFGSKEFRVYAKIYHDSKSKEKYEVVTRKHRRKLAEEVKKAEEQKAAEKTAEIAENKIE